MAGQTKVVFVLLLAMAATAFGNCKKCPGGWSHFNGRCFKYQAIKLDWASAERFCMSLGAHLISIHNEAEYQHAKSVIRAQDRGENPTWIGLFSCEKIIGIHVQMGQYIIRGVVLYVNTYKKPLVQSDNQALNWFWSDGTRVTFTKWNPGEPNSLPNECCVHMNWLHQSGTKNWNDIPCNYAYPFVCVKRSQ